MRAYLRNGICLSVMALILSCGKSNAPQAVQVPKKVQPTTNQTIQPLESQETVAVVTPTPTPKPFSIFPPYPILPPLHLFINIPLPSPMENAPMVGPPPPDPNAPKPAPAPAPAPPPPNPCAGLERNVVIPCCAASGQCANHWLTVTPSGAACIAAMSIFNWQVIPIAAGPQAHFMAASPGFGNKDIAVHIYAGGHATVNFYNYAGKFFGTCQN